MQINQEDEVMSVKAQLEALAKPKKGEDRTKYLNRLVAAIQNIEDDEWEQLSEETQAWANEASKAKNDGQAITDYLDESGEEITAKKKKVKAQAEPKTVAKEEEEDEDENGEEDEEDEEEEEEEKPAAKKKVAAKSKAKPKDEDEDEDSEDEDDEADEESEEEEEEEVAAKKKGAAKKKVAAKKAAPAAAKKSNNVHKPGAQTAIKQMVLAKPDITTEQILDRLEKKGHKASRVTVATIRSGMRDSLKIIKAAGKLDKSVEI